jgi:hypothetical protein
MQPIMKEPVMSISSILFFASCFAMFKLGVQTERHPGQIWELGKRLWKWMQQ